MKQSPSLILLVLALFLAPIMGGQLSLDALGITNPSQILGSLFGGPEAPLLAHALLAMFPLGALAFILVSRRVQQVPNNWISGAMVIFLLVLTGSVLFSSFKSVSMIAALEWLTYGAAFYATVASVGRQRGPALLLAGLTAGCVVVSIRGILEYGQNKAVDPSWRIFASFVNPNALAAMLLLGFFAALALFLTRERLEMLVSGIAIFAISVALILTQSKGALLCLFIAGAFFAVLVVAWGKEARGKAIGRTAVAAGILVLVFVALQFQARSATNGAAAASHLTNISATADQSATFRKNLWKGAIALTEKNPVGTGIGAYKYSSAKPGITPQTQLAHQTYLQLMAEGSPMVLFLFLAIAVMWFFQMFRSAKALPVEQNLLRAGVMAAVLAVGAHSMIDSDFYYFAIGLTMFILMGVGMLLAGDAVAPENVPKGVRYGGAAAAALIAVLLVVFGQVDLAKAKLRGAIMLRDNSAAVAAGESLKTLAMNDGEAWAMLSQLAQPDERKADLEQAVAFAPSTKNLRALARINVEQYELAKAVTLYQSALQSDPNNLLTLSQLADVQMKLGQDWKATLNRLIAVEGSPYFQVRAIPELVPTETYEARLKLAAVDTTDNKYKLLEDAVAGFRQYLATTINSVVQNAKANQTFAGESLDDAKRKMAMAAEASKTLADYYRTRDPERAKGFEEDATKFESAFDGSK